MATRQYIGARYVPKFYQNSVDGSANWESNVVYEPLTYVTLTNEHMYISKKQVPATVGTPASNADYWLDVGSYNGFIDELQGEIDALETVVSTLSPLLSIYNSYKIVNVQYPQNGLNGLVADYTAGSYTDNTSAFQTMVNYYGADTVFYFPEGAYGFDGEINIPYGRVSIIGNDKIYTRLHFNKASGGTFITIGDATQMNALIHVESIGFICDDVTSNTIALHIKNPRTCKLYDIFFMGFSEDVRFEAIVASSGQTSKIEWLWHSNGVRADADCMINFVAASTSIFPNGVFIDNCHGTFSSLGTFVKGNAADIWITRCNIAYCLRCVDITAGNPDVSGDIHINNNVFADCMSYAIFLKHFNRGVIITDNMVEQQANYSGSVFSAFRLSDCNGVIISNNVVGTERTSVLNHFIAFLLCENSNKDFVISNNVGYLGGYVYINGSADSGFIISDNHFEHVGSNTTQANAFYIGNLSNSNIHDNRLKNFAAINSAYNSTNVKNSHNMYESTSTINLPFVAVDNYPI